MMSNPSDPSGPSDPSRRGELPPDEIVGGFGAADDDAHARYRRRNVWAAAGIVAAVAIAGGAVLTSGHGHPSGGSTATGADGAVLAATTTSPSPSPSGKAGHPGPNRMRGFGGPGMPGFGPALAGPLGKVLHGESTVSTPNGGTQVVDTQQGTISKIDTAAKTVTVTSSDKVSFTYVVDSNTRVIDFTLSNPAQATFGNLKSGDTVQIVAVRNGDTRTAKSLVDGTPKARPGGHVGPRFAPPSPKPSSTAAAGTST